jgi:hypothetical protein
MKIKSFQSNLYLLYSPLSPHPESAIILAKFLFLGILKNLFPSANSALSLLNPLVHAGVA